ncbi:MAG: hypothetical protein AB1758_35760, partial [Candidatus Eremiobacterota bacterium]
VLALTGALIGLVWFLPQNNVPVVTRLQETVKVCGFPSLAWDVALSDTPRLQAYALTLPGVRWTAFDSRLGETPKCRAVLAGRGWERDRYRFVESEPGAEPTLWVNQAEFPSQLTPRLGTLLGVRPVPAVRESGFHATEGEAAGQPFRWTDGQAVLEVPLPRGGASRLVVDVSPRPARLRIVVDGSPVWTGPVPERPVVVSLPVRLNGFARIELNSDTFVPHRVDPTSGDRRRLGVAVRGVQLFP